MYRLLLDQKRFCCFKLSLTLYFNCTILVRDPQLRKEDITSSPTRDEDARPERKKVAALSSGHQSDEEDEETSSPKRGI